MHRDSIDVTGDPKSPHRVKFDPFIGIAPFRFRDLFERGRRKSRDGRFIEWVHGTPKSIVAITLATYLSNEEAITKLFLDKAIELKDKKMIEMTEEGGGAARKESNPKLDPNSASQ